MRKVRKVRHKEEFPRNLRFSWCGLLAQVRQKISVEREAFHGSVRLSPSLLGRAGRSGTWGFLADATGYEMGASRAQRNLRIFSALEDFPGNLQDVQGAGAAPWRYSALERLDGPKSHQHYASAITDDDA